MPLSPLPPPVASPADSETAREAYCLALRGLHLTRANYGIGIGVAATLFFRFVAKFGSLVESLNAGGADAFIVLCMLLAAVYARVLLVWGAQGYAMSRGRAPGEGYLGLLGLLGVLILACLPKKPSPWPPWPGILKLPILRVSVGSELI